MRSLVTVQIASIKADLCQYLSKSTALLSAEFGMVVEDVSVFAGAIARDGLAKAFARLPNFSSDLLGRPFIEVADVIADFHVRLVHGPEREIVRKSMLEAYIHAAGPETVFGPPGKTRLVRSLRRYGDRNFAGLIFSLYLFSVISVAIQDKVREKMQDARSFELYMLGVEAVCRETVECSLKSSGAGVDRNWAAAVAKNIEIRLLHTPTVESLQ